jgi:hypothetical protein
MEPRIAPLRNFNSESNTRKCKKCNEWLDLSNFSSRIRLPSPSTKSKDKLVPTLYYRSECKKCSLKTISKSKYCAPDYRRALHAKDPRTSMLTEARKRAKSKGLDFDIIKEDIVIPQLCPLLQIPLKTGKGILSPNSPSLDRIICEKGYVKGNIMVISTKANTAKGNLSLDELKLLVKNLERVLNKEDELLES